MLIKTKDLAGSALDWAVAFATGEVAGKRNDSGSWEVSASARYFSNSFSPSTRWSQCGPLIEEYAISVTPISDATLEAESHTHSSIQTAVDAKCENAYLTAACRAIVAAELGDEVDIPDELVV